MTKKETGARSTNKKIKLSPNRSFNRSFAFFCASRSSFYDQKGNGSEKHKQEDKTFTGERGGGKEEEERWKRGGGMEGVKGCS